MDLTSEIDYEKNLKLHRQMCDIIKICYQKKFIDQKDWHGRDTEKSDACSFLLFRQYLGNPFINNSGFQGQLQDLFVESTDFGELEMSMRNLCEFDYKKWRKS
jgi:hypothetical protein